MPRSPTRSIIGLLVIAAVALFAYGVSGCTTPPCSGLQNTDVTYHGAPGYTAGSVVGHSVWFHPSPLNVRDRHFHILVACERLRRLD